MENVKERGCVRRKTMNGLNIGLNGDVDSFLKILFW